jgi:hypothetical protein
LGVEAVVACARGRVSGASAWAVASYVFTSRSMAARPPTFFVLPKKVGKERRANEGGPAGFPALLALSGGENGLKHVFAEGSDHRSAARRLRWHAGQLTPLSLTLSPSGRGSDAIGTIGCQRAVFHPLPGQGEGRGVGGALDSVAIGDAEQRRVERGSRRKRALARFRRRSNRAAQGTRAAAGVVGAPFFGHFLWQDKESDRPAAAAERRRASEGRCNPSASAACMHISERSSC